MTAKHERNGGLIGDYHLVTLNLESGNAATRFFRTVVIAEDNENELAFDLINLSSLRSEVNRKYFL